MRTFSKAWGLSGIRLGVWQLTKILVIMFQSAGLQLKLTLHIRQLYGLKNNIFKQHVKLVKQGSKYIRKKFKKSRESFHGGKKQTLYC